VEALEDVEHGDLLMTLLVPENHGLKPGSAVIFRGMRTGDVRSVALAPSGTHVEVALRITRKYRQTVTDKSSFWVARPYVSGALFSGFTVTDVSSLLTPYVSYYGEPGKGVLVQNGYRAAAEVNRPSVDIAAVPGEALRQQRAAVRDVDGGPVLVRISYAAVEQDAWSADDPIQRQGCGVLWLDRSGRAVVATARSLVDGSFTESDAFGSDPDIADEQIKVLLGNGTVLRAGRVWVDPAGGDLAALVLEDAPPDLVGTPSTRLGFTAGPGIGPMKLHPVGPDGAVLPVLEFGPSKDAEVLGAAVTAGDVVVGLLARPSGQAADIDMLVPLGSLPADLRPQ
jgi:MlaD protein